MTLFLDPQIVKMVRFMDPEIVKMVNRSFMEVLWSSLATLYNAWRCRRHLNQIFRGQWLYSLKFYPATPSKGKHHRLPKFSWLKWLKRFASNLASLPSLPYFIALSHFFSWQPGARLCFSKSGTNM